LKPRQSVTLVGGATAFSLLGDQALYAILPTYYQEMGLLPIQVGILLAANRFVRVFINHGVERFCRRYSPSFLLGGALAGGAILSAVYALLPLFSVLLIARLLWGVCWSFIRQIGITTVVDSVEPGHLGRSMGLYSVLTRIGSVSGNFIGALGHDLIGFTGILLLFALVSGLAVPLGLLARGALPKADKRKARSADGQSAGWGLLFGGFSLGFVGHGMILSSLGLVLKEAVGDGLQVAGIFIGVATLTGALMSSRWIVDLTAPLLGAFSDRIGRRRGGLLFFSAGALALCLAALGDGLLWLGASVLLFFFCAAGVGVVMAAEAGARGARAVASYATTSDAGACVGPLLAWTMPELQLPTVLIFVWGAAFYAVAGVVARFSFDRGN
jgi:MFS family permease